MQAKLVSVLENKEQLIRFRVYGKSATSAQTDSDGYRQTDRYTLVTIVCSIVTFNMKNSFLPF